MEHLEIEIFVALIAGLLSGIFSEMGGAGALISLPMLISVGLPPIIANGTNRVGTMALYTAAYFSYKSHKTVDFKAASIYSIPIVFGTILGAIIAVQITDIVMQWIIVTMIILLTILDGFAPKIVNKTNASTDPIKLLTFSRLALFFVIGIYCGLVAQVMAFLVYFVLVRIIGIDIEVANGMKFFIAMIVTPVALIFFIASGMINWFAALFLLIGAGFGGFIGERMLTVMRHKSTRYFIILSLAFSLLYLLIFMIKHYQDGIKVI